MEFQHNAEHARMVLCIGFELGQRDSAALPVLGRPYRWS
jgi:hypothetical protein